MINKEPRNISRKCRHRRIRYKISGIPERPRLNVFRSLKHIYAQVIDDMEGRTLVSASSLEPGLKGELAGAGPMDVAKKVGELIAQRTMDLGVAEVVFDRGGYLYHGRVKALAEAAREKGLKF